MIFKNVLAALVVFFLVTACNNRVAAEDQKSKYDKFLGKWDVEAINKGKIFTFAFTFSMKDNKITGTFESVNRGNADLENIEIIKNEMTFTFSLHLGDEKMTKFEIQTIVNKDVMNGALNSSATGLATLTGKKFVKR